MKVSLQLAEDDEHSFTQKSFSAQLAKKLLG